MLQDLDHLWNTRMQKFARDAFFSGKAVGRASSSLFIAVKAWNAPCHLIIAERFRKIRRIVFLTPYELIPVCGPGSRQENCVDSE
jgi:hypothetical protein